MFSLLIKNKLLNNLVLWGFALTIFLSILHLGYHRVDDETIYFYEYAPNIYKDTKNSMLLIIPAIFVVFVVVSAILFFRFYFVQKHRKLLLSFVDTIPVVLSAIPLFVTGIIFIRYLKLDTLYSHNFVYGVICLCLFNTSYLFNKIKKCIEEEYKKPYIAYAYSLGISEKDIFKNYVLPGIIPHIFFTLRELTPHIIVESIVIEYTFAYNALLRTAIQALHYQNWYYLFIFVYELALFLSLCEIIYRWISTKASPSYA